VGSWKQGLEDWTTWAFLAAPVVFFCVFIAAAVYCKYRHIKRL
jgi:heme/copper-type cytochrome/quinol oxidase subunit 3